MRRSCLLEPPTEPPEISIDGPSEFYERCVANPVDPDDELAIRLQAAVCDEMRRIYAAHFGFLEIMAVRDYVESLNAWNRDAYTRCGPLGDAGPR